MSERLPTGEAEETGQLEPAVEIIRLSKRYGAGSNRDRPGPVDDGDDDDVDELVDEPVAEPEPARQEPSGGWALRNVSLTVAPGESLGLIGSNGSGKTTLLKVLARITTPTEGRVVLRGWVAPMIESAASLMVGESSGRRNVWLLSRFFGFPRERVERQMDEIVSFAGLEASIDDKAKTYSSGVYRRLVFSVIVNLQPDILLVDEVLAVGDMAFRQRCIELVESRRRAGMTVLFASHDLEMIRRLCDSAVWIEDGEVVARGGADEVCQEYERSLGIFRALDPLKDPNASPETKWAAVAATVKRGSKTGFNEHAAVISGGMFSPNGGNLGTMRVDEAVVFKMLVEIATPGVELQCTMAIQTKGRAILKIVQPEPFVIPRAGSYVASVSLPPNVLPEAFYTVRLGAWVSLEDARWPLTRQDAFSIEAQLPTDADVDDDSIPGAIDDDTDATKRSDLPWVLVQSTRLSE